MAATQLNLIKRIFVIAFTAQLNLVVTLQSSAKDGEGNTSMITYSSPLEKYSYFLPGYYVSNNAWGAGKLVNGVDYSTSVTFDPEKFQSGTHFSWTFPRSVGGVYAYPHIDYDAQAAGVSSTQAANIGILSANYHVNLSNMTGSTVAFDIWFNHQPSGSWETTSVELLIEVHPTSPGKPNLPFFLTGSGFAGATVHVSDMSAAGANWKFIDVKMPADMMSGTLSISEIIKELIWHGVLAGQEYIASLQFGSEVQGGSGSLQINSLSYDWTANPTLVGSAGNDTFSMRNGGGNHVVGNGGVDTVVYAAPYSSYQMKSVGSGILVINSNKISTLDELLGITSIEFSDGSYNTATGSFVAAPEKK